MAQLRYTIELKNRDVATLLWPAAIAALRASGLMYSPRAWLYVFVTWLRLRFGGDA